MRRKLKRGEVGEEVLTEIKLRGSTSGLEKKIELVVFMLALY